MIPIPPPGEWPEQVKDLHRRIDRMTSDAALCRINGWTPGTILEGDEGHGTTRILLTAIGEERILARQISHNGVPTEESETKWTLKCRDWHKVTE